MRIKRLRNGLLDADITVDDARLDVERAVAHLHAAVALRDALAAELAELVQQQKAA